MKNDEKPLKLEGKDILAFIIAAFQVLMPYVIILAASFVVVMLLLINFWLR